MARTTALPCVALCLLSNAFLLWGKQALAGCDSKGSAWEAPLANLYCPSPGEWLAYQRHPDWPPFLTPLLETLPPLKDKAPPIDYYVQMYSGQSRGAALMRKRQFAQKYHYVLGCCDLQLRRIDVGFLGPYWSVWAGPARSKGAADSLCQDLRLEGLDACVAEPQ
jgi:hypothetical protein